MSKLRLIIAILVMALALVALDGNLLQAGKNDPSIGSGFRCGNLMMSQGLEKMLVLAECGQPAATDKTWIDNYGEVEKLAYGPDAGYYHVLYFFAGKLVKIEDIRQ